MSARLSALGVDELILTPAFDEDVTEYTAETTDATNTITATPEDENATVTIESDDATIASDGTATWVDGENTVTVTVENGTGEYAVSKVYTVVVTASSDDTTPDDNTTPEDNTTPGG